MKSHRSPQSEARVPSYRSEFGSFNYYPTTEFKAAVKNSTNDSQSDTEAPLLRRYHTRLAKSARGASRAASPLAAPRCSEQLGDAPLPMSNLSNPRDSGKSKNKALGVGECHRTTNISAVASEGEQSKRRTGSFPDTVPTDRGGFDGDSVGAVGTKSSEAARSSQGPASCSDPHCIHSRQSIVEFIEMQRELRKCYGIIDDLQKSLSAMEEERLGLREELTLASDRIAIHKCEMANLAAHFEAKLNFYELTSKKGVNKIDDRKNEQENSGDGIVVGETSAWRAGEWEECDQGSALGGETAIYYQQNGIRRDVGSRHGRLRVSDMSTQTLWADSSEFRSPSVAVHGGDSRPLESTLSPHSIEESKTFRGLDQAQIHPPLRTPPHEPTGDDFSTETSAHDEEIPRNRLADQSAAGMRECTSTREVQLSKSPRQNSCERSGDNTAHPASTSTVSVSASSSFDHGESLPVDTNAPTRCAWADLSIKGTEESTDERTFLHNRIQNLESQCRELVRALLMKERQFADMKTNIPTNSMHLPVSFPMSALD